MQVWLGIVQLMHEHHAKDARKKLHRNIYEEIANIITSHYHLVIYLK